MVLQKHSQKSAKTAKKPGAVRVKNHGIFPAYTAKTDFAQKAR